MKLELEQVIIRDEELVVFFPTNAIVEGEIIIAPILTFKTLEEIPPALIEKMFHVTNKMSSSLFELLGCHGTNLLIQNGEVAGHREETLFIRLMPRYTDDKIKLEWTPAQANPQDLEDVVKSFKALDEREEQKIIDQKKQEEIEKKEEPEQIDNKEENYLLKSLRRNP